MGNEQDKVGTAGAAGGASAGPAGEPSWGDVMRFPLACVGAVIGAAVGAWVMKLGVGSGFYAVPAVGLGAGFGTMLLARKNGAVFGAIAAVVALAGSLLMEWWLFPFKADGSLVFFVKHLGDLRGFSMVLHAVGAAVAFWIGGWR